MYLVPLPGTIIQTRMKKFLDYIKGFLTLDKLQHFAVAATIAKVVKIVALIFGCKCLIAILIALAVTALISVGKELYDQLSGEGTPSWGDLIADAAGIIVSLL